MNKRDYARTWAMIGTALLVVGLLGSASMALAQTKSGTPATVAEALDQALGYLVENQLPNGGITGWTPGQADEFASIKTTLAVAGAGYPVDYLTSISDRTPLDYLAQRAITYTHDLSQTLFPGRAGMLAVAAIAGNADARTFGGMNLVSELLATYNEATGAFSTTAKLGFATGRADTVNQAWSVLGLAAAQQEMPAKALDFLVGLQELDGGWGYGFGGDVDLTSVAVQALVAGGLGPTSEAVCQGIAFLRDHQDTSGGWASWGSLSPDSTAAAIQALAATGYVPSSSGWTTSTGGTPRQTLLGLQAADGSFINTVGTAHAIPGLTETPLPILGRLGRANRALSWLGALQSEDGSWAGWSGGDPGVTSDAVLAFVAAGYDPGTVIASGGISCAMGYLASSAADFVALSPDRAGKLTLAAVAGGADPSDFGGLDLAAAIMGHYSPTVGAFGATGTFTNTWYQSLAILGLSAAGAEIPTGTIENLLGLQQPDGGWRYDLSPSPWSGVTPENTSIAMQALVASGVPITDRIIISATAYMRSTQDAHGGWDENANATAAAMQGLLGAGEDLAEWAQGGRTPYEALIDLQKSDGPFVWKWQDPWAGPVDNTMATVQATQALLGLSLADISGQPLAPFVAVDRGPDPDRLVGIQPTVARQNGAALLRLPYGSDANENGAVAIDWRTEHTTSWITGTATIRADGYLTATVPADEPILFEFRVTWMDADGVQYGGALTPSISLHVILEPNRVYLPAIISQ